MKTANLLKTISLFTFLISTNIFAANSVEAPAPMDGYSKVSEKSENLNWKIDSTLSLPFRGFDIQTGASASGTAQDKLGTVSYMPSPSLEGKINVSYKGLGFYYERTLVAASLNSDLDLPASVNEGFNFNLFLMNHLFEITHQNLRGMQTTLSTDGTNDKKIAREDLKLNDTRIRWVYGLPIWGSEQPNSLANFYTNADITLGDKSFDLLTSVEFVQQEISGDSPFVPLERQNVFGTASSLSKVSSLGLGAGVGIGFTAMMHEKSYFSIGGLLGGNYNSSKSQYADKTEVTSGFGSYMNAWMSVQFVYGLKNQHNLGFKLAHTNWTIPAKENKVNSMNSAMSLNYGVAF